MSVPAQLMQRAMGGAGAQMGPTAGATGGAPPGATGPSNPENPFGGTPGQPPRAAPMSTPQEKKGLKTAAATNVHIAVNMLEEALPAYGSESQEGEKIIAALKILSKLVAKRDSSDLVPAEILQMVKRLPQMGGGTAVQQAIMKQMNQAKQAPAPAPAAA